MDRVVEWLYICSFGHGSSGGMFVCISVQLVIMDRVVEWFVCIAVRSFVWCRLGALITLFAWTLYVYRPYFVLTSSAGARVNCHESGLDDGRKHESHVSRSPCCASSIN